MPGSLSDTACRQACCLAQLHATAPLLSDPRLWLLLLSLLFFPLYLSRITLLVLKEEITTAADRTSLWTKPAKGHFLTWHRCLTSVLPGPHSFLASSTHPWPVSFSCKVWSSIYVESGLKPGQQALKKAVFNYKTFSTFNPLYF